MNRYTYSFSAKCPNDNKQIEYKLLIESESMIQAEDIVRVCSKSDGYQEYIATVIKEQLGGKINLSGTHSGVFIESVL